MSKNKIAVNEIKKWGILSLLIFTLTQILTLITPLIMKRVIDDYIPNRNISSIIIGITLFVTVPLLYIGSQILFNYFSIKFARNKGNEIGIQILENLVHQDMNFFDNNNSIELLTYSSKEATSYVYFYISELPRYYAYIAMSVIIFLILMFYSWPVALLQLLFIPFSIIPLKKVSNNLQRDIELVVESNAKIAQIKSDIFKGIELIKSLRLENKKIYEVRSQNNKIVKVWGRISALDSSTGIWVSGFLTMLFTGLTFGLGTIIALTNEGVMTVGILVSILAYISMFYSYFEMIINTKLNQDKQEAEYQKVFEYLELKGEREANQNKKSVVPKDVIRFKDVEFSYATQDKQILRNFNLDLPIGKWSGICGKSGSGKSTIFNLILGLYTVDSGEILFDTNSINEISSFSIRDAITKVSQDIFLFPGTIKENLLLANPSASDKDIEEAVKFACLDDYISGLPEGLDTDVGEAGKLMSGGEKQRLSLAQGILRRNKILLLDEITSNVDAKSEQKIKENIKRLVDEEGYTIISISHNEAFHEYADVTYNMDSN